MSSTMLVLAAALAFVTAAQAEGPEIWLAPQELGPQRVSAVDYQALFKPEAPWSFAATHVQVFKFYSGYLLNAPQADVNAMVADLNRRHIAIAIEDGPMNVAHNPASGCGGLGNVEGYGTVTRANRLAQIIKTAQGTLKFLAMDEPFYYGHYFLRGANKGTGCQSSVEEILGLIKPTLTAFIEQFPQVQIGDVEPTLMVGDEPNWERDLTAWIRGFRNTMGKELAFYDLDVEWPRPNVETEVTALHRVIGGLQHEKLIGRVGVIYNGGGRDTSDAGWILDARAHVMWVEGQLHWHPDQVIFQSWDPYPTHTLPESAPDSLTSLVGFYFSPRVKALRGVR